MKNVLALVPFRTSIDALNIVFYLAGCVILSYLFAKLYHSSFADKALSTLRIRRTTHPYLWNDLTDHEDSLWVKIGYKDLDLKYFGMLTTYEETQRYPQIVLSAYTKGTYDQDLQEQYLEEYTGKLNYSVVLDTSKADFIEFISKPKPKS